MMSVSLAGRVQHQSGPFAFQAKGLLGCEGWLFNLLLINFSEDSSIGWLCRL